MAAQYTRTHTHTQAGRISNRLYDFNLRATRDVESEKFRFKSIL